MGAPNTQNSFSSPESFLAESKACLSANIETIDKQIAGSPTAEIRK